MINLKDKLNKAKTKSRILAYIVAKDFSLEELKEISGGGAKFGTKNACVQGTLKNGHPDAEADVNYDW